MLLLYFNGDLKERYDDEYFSKHFPRTIHLRSFGAEQEQLAPGDPGYGP